MISLGRREGDSEARHEPEGADDWAHEDADDNEKGDLHGDSGIVRQLKMEYYKHYGIHEL